MTADSTPEAGSGGDAGAGAGDAAAELDFEACMQRLDEIVQELESGQVPLARAMSLFEEGLRLGKTCRSLLDTAQVQVDRLLERADGAIETQPFES